MGGMELYRRWNGIVLQEEIETHHLFVDDQRILMAEHILQTNNNQLTMAIIFFTEVKFINYSASKDWLTRSLSSLPGLKCGTYLEPTFTLSPVLGLRPTRGGR